MSFGSIPDVVNSDGHGGWTSGADQTPAVPDHVAATAPGRRRMPAPTPSASSARPRAASPGPASSPSSRCSPTSIRRLVTLFDKQAQGALVQVHFASGEASAVSIDGSAGPGDAGEPQQPVRLRRLLRQLRRGARGAPGGGGRDGGRRHNDQTAIVRMRQDGTDSLSLTFYRVDDSQRHDQRPASGRCRLPGGAAEPGLSD